MNTRNLTQEERYELVLECRRSGLSDYQWLEEHGIRRSTFYKWIHDFRENGYPDIPEPMRQRSPHKPQPQEVIKVDLVPDTGHRIPEPMPLSTGQPVAEIISGRTVIRLTNAVDPALLRTLLAGLGGTM
ncbi:MAG: transposase [Firmicutes bacterium]|nr:transposase [Bacillota bacterium]